MKFICILFLTSVSKSLCHTDFLHLSNDKYIYAPDRYNIKLISYTNSSEIYQSFTSCTEFSCNKTHIFNMHNFVSVKSSNKKLFKNLCISTNLFQRCFSDFANHRKNVLKVFKINEVINNNTHIDFVQPVITHTYLFRVNNCTKSYRLKVVVTQTEIVSLLFFNKKKNLFNDKTFSIKKNKCVY